MNEVLKLLSDRKSVRVYMDQPITDEEKQAILTAAIQAPSAKNLLQYRIIDITDDALQQQLAVLCDNQPFIAAAPMALVFVADPQRIYDAYQAGNCSPRLPGTGEWMWAVSDAQFAAQNAVIAAESLGIGSCYIGDILQHCDQIRTLLSLPVFAVPTCMVVFGHPTEQQISRRKPKRPNVKMIVNENHYQRYSADELREIYTYRTGRQPYDEWIAAFCADRHNTEFGKALSRSVDEYLKAFQQPDDDAEPRS